MKVFEEIFLHLPERIRIELGSILAARPLGVLSEIRLRATGRSSILISGEKINLSLRISNEEIEKILYSLCEGSPYAYHDTLNEGYVSLAHGVRVGVCGRAVYEGDKPVGIKDVSSLVFRIPLGECEFKDEVYAAFLKAKNGMLIYSEPGLGKTSALRALSLLIGQGVHSKNVVVIDERGEFLPQHYVNASVDILRGYKRARGMEIALRTLGAEVIVIDEIGTEGEARLISEFMRAGAKVVATAHARSVGELYRRAGVREILSSGAFDVLFGINLLEGKRTFKVTRNEERCEWDTIFDENHTSQDRECTKKSEPYREIIL